MAGIDIKKIEKVEKTSGVEVDLTKEKAQSEMGASKIQVESESKSSDKKIVDVDEEKKESPKKNNIVIDFQHVKKEYAGGIVAVDDVSFDIKVGEFVSLVGPSGAGKSTLIRMLTCAERPSSGKIIVAGRDITLLKEKDLPYFRRKVGVIFQDFKLLPKKTVYENIAFALEVSGASNSEIKESTDKIIEIVGLTNRVKSLSEELSGGEKQRVSIARALVHKPKILIADEPTGNLDPVTTWEIIELLFKINRQGTIVLLATHDKEVVDALQRRVITMRDGKVVADQLHGKYIL